MLDLSSFSSLGSMGTIGNYTKQLALETRWKQKKASGEIVKTPRYDPSSYKTAAGKEMAQRKNENLDAIDRLREEQEEKDSKYEAITKKLFYGGMPNDEELEYIRQKNPALYEKLKAEMQEEKKIEEKLKQAKTKEEAQKVMQDHAMQALSAVKSVNDNPYISDSDKIALNASELRKLQYGKRAFERFVKTGEYSKLPTEAEKEIAEKELKEAKEEELQKNSDSEAAKDAEKAQEKENADSTSENATGETDKNAVEETAEETQKKAEEEIRKNLTALTKRSGHNPSDNNPEHASENPAEIDKQRRMTMAEAESTPEAEKVKKAGRKAGTYTPYISRNAGGAVSLPASAGQNFDHQA